MYEHKLPPPLAGGEKLFPPLSMIFFMDFAQLGIRDMGVNLGCSNVGMS